MGSRVKGLFFLTAVFKKANFRYFLKQWLALFISVFYDVFVHLRLETSTGQWSERNNDN